MTETTPKPRTPRGPEKPETTFAKVVAKLATLDRAAKADIAFAINTGLTAEEVRENSAEMRRAADAAHETAKAKAKHDEADADRLELIEKLTPEFRAAVLAMLEAK